MYNRCVAILIDGYNLLHGSGILPRGVGPATLERARAALLNFLAESLEAGEVPQTTVVFDAAAAPPGLPRLVEHRGLKVRFADAGQSADDVIEELIRLDSTPRRLTVVSSDHRLHRAARRRKATPIDSDRWYHEVRERRSARGAPPDAGKPASQSKPGFTVSEEETAYWLTQFGLDAESRATDHDHSTQHSAHHDRDADTERADEDPDFEAADSDESGYDPFPPGYGEDVTEDDV